MQYRLPLRSVKDVAERQLCSGCGACAYADPEHVVMVDTLDYGRRPFIKKAYTSEAEGRAGLAVCPGIDLSHPAGRLREDGVIRSLAPGWGPILEVWEGYATDGEIRRAGSSGGAASGLALHGLEHEGIHGTLHIDARPDVRYLNQTVMSRTREELLARTGSRYAPASPCDGLERIEQAPGPCVFIGKPCDAAAVQKAARSNPRLAERLGLVVAFFCAGTPTTRGTLAMLARMGIDPERLTSLRYRGNGWPGLATGIERAPDGTEHRSQLTYDQSWGQVLSHHQLFRCNICPDHTGEFADIAVGDPWYREIPADEPGRSLILVRTERGRAYLARAIAAGSIHAERVDPSVLPKSQMGLLRARGAFWGRCLTLRAFGLPVPRLRGIATFRHWLRELSLHGRIQSFYGTARRVFSRGLRRGARVVPWRPTRKR